MSIVHQCTLPENALLQRYARPLGVDQPVAYTDCFRTRIDARADFSTCVFAFYTTWLFKLERSILSALAASPSSDAEAHALATGRADAFAAWTVEARQQNQLLLRDISGRTRSWLMSVPSDGAGASTELYFGSAVVPSARRPGSFGVGIRLLMPAHRIYSRMLLGAAQSRLVRTR